MNVQQGDILSVELFTKCVYRVIDPVIKYQKVVSIGQAA